jgi:DNA-binding CsgD family transcriptional regulator
MIRAIVTKEVTVNDRNAADILTLIRSGFNVRFVDSSVHKIEPAVRIRRRRRAPNLTKEQLTEMVALRKKGLPTRSLARRFKLSVSGVRNALARVQNGVVKKGAAT